MRLYYIIIFLLITNICYSQILSDRETTNSVTIGKTYTDSLIRVNTFSDYVYGKLGGVERVLLKAIDSVGRVGLVSTSISAGGDGSIARLAQTLELLRGSTEGDRSWGAVMNGTYTGTVQTSWLKQQYNGPQYVRVVSDTTGVSDELIFNTFGRYIGISYSMESIGDSAFVYIDDVLVGTINCEGPQSYAHEIIYDTGVSAYHELRIVTEGQQGRRFFLESIFCRNKNTGIELYDYRQGGTSLASHFDDNNNTTDYDVDKIVLEDEFNGLRSTLENSGIDLLLFAGFVNDLNNENWDQFPERFDSLCKFTEQLDIPLIYVIEMGGHHHNPLDDNNLYFRWNYNMDKIDSIYQHYEHVTIVNWAKATLPNDDDSEGFIKYADRWYNVHLRDTTIGGVDGFYDLGTGSSDFIHPKFGAHDVATELLFRSAGIDVLGLTGYDEFNEEYLNKRRSSSNLVQNNNYSFEGELSRSTGLDAIVGGTDKITEPLRVTEGESLLGRTFYTSFTGEDEFGSFLPLNTTLVVTTNRIEIGDTLTVTLLYTTDTGLNLDPESNSEVHSGIWNGGIWDGTLRFPVTKFPRYGVARMVKNNDDLGYFRITSDSAHIYGIWITKGYNDATVLNTPSRQNGAYINKSVEGDSLRRGQLIYNDGTNKDWFYNYEGLAIGLVDSIDYGPSPYYSLISADSSDTRYDLKIYKHTLGSGSEYDPSEDNDDYTTTPNWYPTTPTQDHTVALPGNGQAFNGETYSLFVNANVSRIRIKLEGDTTLWYDGRNWVGNSRNLFLTGASLAAQKLRPKVATFNVPTGSLAASLGTNPIIEIYMRLADQNEALQYYGGYWIVSRGLPICAVPPISKLPGTDVSINYTPSYYSLPSDDLEGLAEAVDNITQTINSHDDVTITTPQEGDILRYLSGEWVNDYPYQDSLGHEYWKDLATTRADSIAVVGGDTVEIDMGLFTELMSALPTRGSGASGFIDTLTNKVQPDCLNCGYDFRFNIDIYSTTANSYIVLLVDVGTGLGGEDFIVERTITMPKGNNVWNPQSVAFPIFGSQAALDNGFRFYITSPNAFSYAASSYYIKKDLNR